MANAEVPTLVGRASESVVFSSIADKDAPNKHTSEDEHLLRVSIIQLQLGAFAACPSQGRDGNRPAHHIAVAATYLCLCMCEWDAGMASNVRIVIRTSGLSRNRGTH